MATLPNGECNISKYYWVSANLLRKPPTSMIFFSAMIFNFRGYVFCKCEYCCKLFSNGRKLKQQICTVHEGHKDYKCDYCGKSFSEARKLKKHIHTVHEGHNDYKCESCGKSFSQSGHLRRHICTVHEGQK